MMQVVDIVGEPSTSHLNFFVNKIYDMMNIGDICFDIGCMWMLYDASSGFCWSKMVNPQDEP